MRTSLTVTAIALAAATGAASLTACSSPSSGDTPAAASPPATTAATPASATTATAPAGDEAGPAVAVTIGTPKAFSLALSSPTVAAGQVTFTAKNSGSMPHELVVLRTAQKAAKLPMEAGGKAKETGHVGEIPDLPAGATKPVTLTLTPGHYSVVCNLPGHYMGGMRADLTVT